MKLVYRYYLAALAIHMNSFAANDFNTARFGNDEA